MDKDIIQKLAQLARLKVDNNEVKIYGRQLSAVLHHLNSLEQAMSLISKYGGRDGVGKEHNDDINFSLADDEVKNWPKDEVAVSLKAASRNEDGFIIVPVIKS